MSNDIAGRETASGWKYTLIGGVLGAIIGIAAGFLYSYGIYSFPATRHILKLFPLSPIITAAFLGVLIGAAIGVLIDFLISPDFNHNRKTSSGMSIVNNKISSNNSGVSIRLHEEKLDISKSKIQQAQVNIHKEVITENKKFTVPVDHENLIIEKTICDNSGDNNGADRTQTIRIPLKEEIVDLSKHSIPINDVSINRHSYEENKHISETLKKEKLQVKTNGNVNIIKNENNK